MPNTTSLSGFTDLDLESISGASFKSSEIILFDTLNLGLQLIREDYAENVLTPENSWLYRLLRTIHLQRYKYYEQAVAIFCNPVDDPRHLKIDMTYNAKIDTPPTVFLSLSQDTMSDNNIGIEHQQGGYFLNSQNIPTEYTFTKTRRFDSSIGIYIYSDNSNETMLIYSVLRSLLITLSDQLSLLGLHNLSYSGQDIAQYPDFIPKGFFYRALTVKCNYSTSSPDLSGYLFIRKFLFEGVPTKE